MVSQGGISQDKKFSLDFKQETWLRRLFQKGNIKECGLAKLHVGKEEVLISKAKMGSASQKESVIYIFKSFRDLMDILTEGRKRNLRKVQFLPMPKGRGSLQKFRENK